MKKKNIELPQNSRRNFMKQAAAFTSVPAAIGITPLMAFNGTAPRNDEFVRAQEKKKDRKVAVVAGAARGIGRSVCVALAKEGIDIFGIDI